MRLIFRKIIGIFLFLFPLCLFAQREADFWYFGNYAGINFASGRPEPVVDGALKNFEGCASISDSTGRLLFYTNGISVWNRYHEIMENGEDLAGDTSSTQSAIIIPIPENNDQFYIFTVDIIDTIFLETVGLRYSLVDLSFNSGAGKIVEKNIALLDSSLEKITAVKHQNNNDYWLIGHEWRSSDFYVWLIDENGISSTPVISSTGFDYQYPLGNAVGYLKANSQGDMLVAGIMLYGKFEVYAFDNLTGEVVFLFEIDFDGFVYGCEFSPDGSKLYMTGIQSLYQVDMNAGTPEDIVNSLTEIHTSDYFLGALQNGPDGKIYLSSDTSYYLSIIHTPNAPASLCNFQADAVYLDGRISRLGLPNFIPSYFLPPVISVEQVCMYDTTHFIIEHLSNIDSVQWNFGDIESGVNNESDLVSPFHVFSDTGYYYVTLHVWDTGIENTYHTNVRIVALPFIELGKDTVTCHNNAIDLNASGSHLSYLWNDLSTDSILTVNESGRYFVEVQNIYTTCKNRDTIDVFYADPPFVDLGQDTIFCENLGYLIDVFCDSCEYIWQDLSTESYYEAYTGGEYYVSIKNKYGCVASDTVHLEALSIPKFYFPTDTVMCENRVLEFTFRFEEAEYSWQDGHQDSIYYIYEPGEYQLTISNRCGSWTDNITVYYEWCGDIFIPNVISPNDDEVNQTFKIKGLSGKGWKLFIYNRWGSEVIRYENYDNSWTGKDSQGETLSEGVYYYILENTTINRIWRGTIRIIR